MAGKAETKTIKPKRNPQNASFTVIKFLFYVLEELYYKNKESKYVQIEHIDYKNGYVEHFITVRNAQKNLYGKIQINEYSSDYSRNKSE